MQVLAHAMTQASVTKWLYTAVARNVLLLCVYLPSYIAKHGTFPGEDDFTMLQKPVIVHLRLGMLISYLGNAENLHEEYQHIANAKDLVTEADKIEAYYSAAFQAQTGGPYPPDSWIPTAAQE